MTIDLINYLQNLPWDSINWAKFGSIYLDLTVLSVILCNTFPRFVLNIYAAPYHVIERYGSDFDEVFIYHLVLCTLGAAIWPIYLVRTIQIKGKDWFKWMF